MVIVCVERQPEVRLQPHGLVEIDSDTQGGGTRRRVPAVSSVEVTVLGRPSPAILGLQGERSEVRVDWGDGPWEIERATIEVRADAQTTTVCIRPSSGLDRRIEHGPDLLGERVGGEGLLQEAAVARVAAPRGV